MLQNKSEEREGVEGLVVWADGHALAGALDGHMAYYGDGHARGCGHGRMSRNFTRGRS